MPPRRPQRGGFRGAGLALILGGISVCAGERSLSPGDDLPRVIAAASPGDTFLLADGLYRLSRPIVITRSGVTLRSASGQRSRVILDGKTGEGPLRREACIPEIVAVKASTVTLADLTIVHARDHGIHISPTDTESIRDVVMRNIRVADCGQQLIKVNSNGREPLRWVDDGILEDSLIEFVDTSIMQNMVRYFYTGGLDVHGGRGWVIRRNTFRNIQREGKMMEHAVHMWSRSRDTVVEKNRFIDCYRAVGFGMKTAPKGWTRSYPDGQGEEPYFDHLGGVVRDNMMFNRKGIHLESGIELMNVSGARIEHNTVVSHDAPFSSIEYRWPNTRVTISGNVVSHRIRARDGAKAKLDGNVEQAPGRLFRDYGRGDLRLRTGGIAGGEIRGNRYWEK